MSLSDALLLEPYRDPLEIWISNFGPGAPRGSGTQADPFNAATVPYSAVIVNPLTSSNGTATATVPNHGFKTGDWVTIAGVDVPYSGIGSQDTYYLGTFQINVTGDNTFTYQMTAVPDRSPAIADTDAQNIACWKERETFDAIMRGVPAHALVHITGVIETKGVSRYIAGGWKPQNGLRIVGSSMASTTLKLVGASRRNADYAAIGLDYFEFADGFQTEDFTIDCALDEQPSPYVVCGAIRFEGGGRHVRIRRVRAIRFGSRSPDTYIENFVFFIGSDAAKETYHNVIEECVAEMPSPNVYWNSTIFHMGGGWYNGKSLYHRACVLRRNCVNGQIVYGPRVEVDSISFSGTTAIITTKSPHGYSAPGNVSVQGILVGGSLVNAFNGVFAIDSTTDTTISYTPYPADGPTAMGLTAGSSAIVGAPVSPHALPVLSLTLVSGSRYRAKTTIPHNQTANNFFKIRGIKVRLNDGTVLDPWSVADHTPYRGNPFNGAFRVASVFSKLEVDYDLVLGLNVDFSSVEGDMVLGQGHQALAADNGKCAIVEENRILHCATAGPYHDTFSTRDLIIRGNYYDDCLAGPIQNFGPSLLTLDTNNPGQACVFTLLGRTVQCDTTPVEHDLLVGQGVRVTESGAFNGDYKITAVGKMSLNFELTSIPGSPPASGKFTGLGQVGTWIIEDNVIELALTRPDYWAGPNAIYVGMASNDFLTAPFNFFRQIIIRRNVIRQLAALSVSNYAGITVQKADNVIIENNVIELGQSEPIQVQKCGSIRIFNNRKAGGQLIRGQSRDTGLPTDDLATLLGDTLLLSI